MSVIGFPNASKEQWTKPKTLEDWPWEKDLGKPYGDINGDVRPEIVGEAQAAMPAAAAEIEALLSERSKTHGDYCVKAEIIQDIKSIMRSADNWYEALNDMQRESLDMIAHKIGRILSGDPNVTDHWADIAGYATLPIRGMQ